MLEEKLLKKLKTINENFINLGFDLEEDLEEGHGFIMLKVVLLFIGFLKLLLMWY